MEKIKSQIIEWASKNLGNDFKFRENQLETISQIIYEKIHNINDHHIIQAPTGSGKSLINIISAGVLWRYYGKKSYILCSDLYLYQQYVDFIDANNLEEFRYVKGQTGNYYCEKAGSDGRNCYCKMAGVSYRKLGSLLIGFDQTHPDYKELKKLQKTFNCVHNCQFIKERIIATLAPITLMTYQLFYFQMNICGQKYDLHGNPIFGQFLYRDYIFCDECHNIPNIMQNRCQPTIQYDDFKRMLKIYNYYKSLKKNPSKIKLLQKINEAEIENNFKEYWKQMLDNSLDSYHNTILLMNYTHKLVDKIAYIGERIQKMLGNKIKNGYTLDDSQKSIYGEITWLQNYHCYLDDFCRAIKLTGYHYTFKQKCLGNIIKFGCVKEDGIIYQFLLRYGLCGTVLCSATLGNVESFIENCGYKHFENNSFVVNMFAKGTLEYILKPDAKYLDIPSNFDFSNSPIYLDLEHKMSYNTKNKSIQPISEKINLILDNHYNENGLIQTGSYENAKKFYNLISSENKHRILLYKNSEEKTKFIKMINSNTNYVIMGPSLNEGIDLPNDLCSFIITAKVPFLSLGDKYVTTKMKIFKKWYNDSAVINLIQGIGRGNRHKNDYSSIYILDGAFKRLFSYTKKTWPEYITKRFIYTNINDLFNFKEAA